MSTLRGLSGEDKHQVRRSNDEAHYGHLIRAWDGVKGNWPTGLDEAGQATLLYAVVLAFLYKGQTDYPDGDSNACLFHLLDQCKHVDANDDLEWKRVLEKLDALPGIGLARASVLLHCMFPDSFPIVDVNATKALCDWCEGWPERVERPRCEAKEMTSQAAGYLEYRRVLLDLVEESRITAGCHLCLRKVELALYKSGADGSSKGITGL